MHLVHDIHHPMLVEWGFTPEKSETSAWFVYKLKDNKIGSGEYRIFSPNGMYAIAIHDFTFHKEMMLHSVLPEYLSITWYNTVAGDAFMPYKRMHRDFVMGYHSTKEGYHALIHKNIPMYAIGIEITPEYCEKYLSAKYPGEFIHPTDVFLSVNQTNDFPEMIYLLNQIKNFSGESTEAELFYEGKVREAMALLIGRTRQMKSAATISSQDIECIDSVTSYINDHFIYDLRLDTLVQIGCMSPTKLKMLFKRTHGCTITEYIQRRRIHHAEMLLSNTDLPIATIAQSVGYRSPSRFTKLFQRDTGLLPNEYRKMSNK